MANKKFRVTVRVTKDVTRIVNAPNEKTAIKKLKDTLKTKHNVGDNDLFELEAEEAIF